MPNLTTGPSHKEVEDLFTSSLPSILMVTKRHYTSTAGYYTLCIDNKPSSFQSKLVSLYVASFKRDEWEKYIAELTEADLTTNNATNLLRNVDSNIHEMLKHLENSKQHYTYDSYLIESNRE